MLAVFGRWLPLAVILAAVALGFFLESVVLRAFYAWAKRRHLTTWRVVVDAVRGVAVLWSAAAGIYVALLLFPLPANGERFAKGSLVVLVIWSVTVVAARVGVRLVKNFNESSQAVDKTASLFTTLTSIAVYAIGAMVVLRYLGINLGPVLTALGVGGLAVALALRDTLSNFFSGLQIIASRQVRVGDFIRLESGREGYVTDITWLHTTVREPSNSLIVVPNEKIASAAFTNLSLPSDLTTVGADVNLAYGNDLALVEAITLEVAGSVQADYAAGSPAPSVRFRSADDRGLTMTTFLRLREYGDQLLVVHEFYKRLFMRYQQEGVALAHVPWASTDAEPPDPDAAADTLMRYAKGKISPKLAP